MAHNTYERLTMEIITDIYNCKATPCAATVGSFDGVHLGHVAMLGELRAAAETRKLPVAAVTFKRHPRMLFDGQCEPFLLTTNKEKTMLLEKAGVDMLVMLDFDSYMASMSAERFMKEILSESLGVRMLAVGYDHHFGKPCDDEGIGQYKEYGNRHCIEVFETKPFDVNGCRVSSSCVRRALAAGDMTTALSLLGHKYSIEGTVVHGAGVGHRLGFPTANILTSEEMLMLPYDGVYEVDTFVEGSRYKGVMNIGFKPTVNDSRVRTIEVYLIDFSADIYGSAIRVEPLRRLRDEKAFGNADALRFQIEVDVARVKRGI